MSRSCESCESLDFAIECYERVCTRCGQVQEELPGEENQLEMLPDHQTIKDNKGSKIFDTGGRLNNRIRGETQSNESRRRISKAKILDEIRRTVKKLIKEPNTLEETMGLIGSTFQAHQKRLSSDKKNGLAGACIYYLSAKHQLGISLKDICKALDIRIKVINICLKEVRSLCPDFEYERPNIRDLVRKFVDKIASKNYDMATTRSELDGSCNTQIRMSPKPLIENKDKKVLEDRVMLLLDIFETMYPYKQPSPQSLITAVIYHAWKSLDTFKVLASSLRRSFQDTGGSESPPPLIVADNEVSQMQIIAKHSIGYEKFCEMCRLKYSSNGHKIVTKLQSSLLDLGRHLGNVNKLNLPWYLKDIIENSPHLIKEHKRNEPSTTKQAIECERESSHCDVEA